MSYSLVMLARRIAALEQLPSARAPLRIVGGLPPDYQPRAVPSPGPKEVDRRGRLPTSTTAAKQTESLGQPGAE
jgi:hypothetical protein